ncbi:ABC transporter substrate-binding protein [Nocardioidaceae bacterium]|nr:ABC transporter substrate-binding protein [Nocardioidaceae bacterium]
MTRIPRTLTTGLALAAALTLGACGTSSTGAGTSDTGDTGDTGASAGYPVTLENCGADVTLEEPPERVVLLKSASVPYLGALGVLDRVEARAGQYPAAYYDEETLAALDQVPTLTDELDPAGHLQISREVVIAQEPDLVLGEVENLSRSTLASSGIPLLEEPALCAEGIDDPGFDDVASQMRAYGRVFDRPAEADQAVEDLEQRLAAVRSEVEDGTGRTAAVLYPTVGGGTTYAYGNRSMADPQLEAAGLTNVFGDVDERVVEVTLEELLGRDPDVLVLLHSEGEPGPVQDALTGLPGAEDLTAVREDQVMVQLFNFTEPPSPLVVDGLEQIVDRFGAGS